MNISKIFLLSLSLLSLVGLAHAAIKQSDYADADSYKGSKDVFFTRVDEIDINQPNYFDGNEFRSKIIRIKAGDQFTIGGLTFGDDRGAVLYHTLNSIDKKMVHLKGQYHQGHWDTEGFIFKALKPGRSEITLLYDGWDLYHFTIIAE
jgi:hypothetical protein